MSERAEWTGRYNIPCTVDHSDSIVRLYSYNVMVNPELDGIELVCRQERHRKG